MTRDGEDLEWFFSVYCQSEYHEARYAEEKTGDD